MYRHLSIKDARKTDIQSDRKTHIHIYMLVHLQSLNQSKFDIYVIWFDTVNT